MGWSGGRRIWGGGGGGGGGLKRGTVGENLGI